MRAEGIQRLTIEPNDQMEDLPGPDTSDHAVFFSQLVGSRSVRTVFDTLRYNGPMELMCVWACLIAPKFKSTKARKRPRETIKGDHVRHGDRVFQSLKQFCRCSGINQMTVKSYQKLVNAQYAECDTLYITQADQLPRHWLQGECDLSETAGVYLKTQLSRPLRSAYRNVLVLHAWDVMEAIRLTAL